MSNPSISSHLPSYSASSSSCMGAEDKETPSETGSALVETPSSILQRTTGASTSSSPLTLQRLLKQPSTTLADLFHASVFNGNRETIPLCLEFPPSTQNLKGHTVLHTAALHGWQIDKALVEQWSKDDPRFIDTLDNHGWTALHYAVQKKQKDLVALLLLCGANPNLKTGPGNRGDITPLYLAACSGDEDILNQLIEAGAEVDARSGKGLLTASHAAALTGNVVALRILNEANKTPWQKSSGGKTTLHYAAIGDHPEIIAYLASQPNAPIDARCSACKLTPLHYTILHSHEAALNALIRAGASIHELIPTIDGIKTYPLNQAVSLGNKGVVKALLKVTPQGSISMSLLDFAKKKGHEEIYTLLCHWVALSTSKANQAKIQRAIVTNRRPNPSRKSAT